VQAGADLPRKIAFPTVVQQQGTVAPLLGNLSTTRLRNDLTQFSSYNNRHYQSTTGVTSANWLFDQATAIITDSGTRGQVRRVQHNFRQPSIVVTIPGQSEKIVVVGAHQDSLSAGGSSASAPGADDNGSGSITILEALRALVRAPNVAQGRASNTIEFHWYAGEEAGLLGSQAIFSQYSREGRDVVAMLNQDMTGYIQGTLNAGRPESFGLITDNVDPALTDFTKLVIAEVRRPPPVLF
jgi:leucyl aminopeptidase